MFPNDLRQIVSARIMKQETRSGSKRRQPNYNEEDGNGKE